MDTLKRWLHCLGHISLITTTVIVFGLSCANANTIFTEDFNSYSGNQNANQINTGYQVAYGGNVSGWSHGGLNALHAVNPGGGSDWEIMFYNDNTTTLNSSIAGSNVAGQSYSLTFNYGTGCYATSQCTKLGDGLVVQLLDPNTNVVAQGTYLPGAWGAGNYDFQAGLQGLLSYTGTGSGNLSITIFANQQTRADGTFGGTIDNLALQSVPEPGAFVLVFMGLTGLTLSATRRRCSKITAK